jgi:hypothetical protein
VQINLEKLQTVTNFSKRHQYTRQHVYYLIKNNEINSLEIDGIVFVVIDEKAETFTRKRKPKTGLKKNDLK